MFVYFSCQLNAYMDELVHAGRKKEDTVRPDNVCKRAHVCVCVKTVPTTAPVFDKGLRYDLQEDVEFIRCFSAALLAPALESEVRCVASSWDR